MEDHRMDSQEEPGEFTIEAPPDRRAEVEALLADDQTVLGRYRQYTAEGLTREEMSEREGLTTLGWTSNYQSLLECLRDGKVTTSPTVARQHAARLRSWLKQKPLSDSLRASLIEQEKVLVAVAEDREAQADEDAAAVAKTEQAESSGTPGVYVYTLPHYLKHRYDPDTGRTLLKVGHSSVDVYYRTGSQGRLTALPEDPILLRIYPCEDSRAMEQKFYAWLRDADHPGSRAKRGGAEWYVTSTKFLDRVARAHGLDVVEVNEDEWTAE